MCLVPLCFVSCSFLNGLSHICIQILCVSVADTDEGILIYFETGLSVVFNLLGFLTGQPVYIYINACWITQSVQCSMTARQSKFIRS